MKYATVLEGSSFDPASSGGENER